MVIRKHGFFCVPSLAVIRECVKKKFCSVPCKIKKVDVLSRIGVGLPLKFDFLMFNNCCAIVMQLFRTKSFRSCNCKYIFFTLILNYFEISEGGII